MLVFCPTPASCAVQKIVLSTVLFTSGGSNLHHAGPEGVCLGRKAGLQEESHKARERRGQTKTNSQVSGHLLA